MVKLIAIHQQNLYSRKLKSSLSEGTVKYIHTVNHRSLSQALKWGLVARNVAEAIEVLKPNIKAVEPLILPQVAKFLGSLMGDR